MNNYDKNYAEYSHKIVQTPVMKFEKPQSNSVQINYQTDYIDEIQMEKRLELDETLAAHFKNAHSHRQRFQSQQGFKIIAKQRLTTDQERITIKKQTIDLEQVLDDQKYQFIKIVDTDIHNQGKSIQLSQKLKKRQCNPQITSCPLIEPLVKIRKDSCYK
ncbi:Hypothetical_protein [Hexamita inflata]|uniref:Hypothetical_protein n=1 Tax=Hexamita inflata TaxID=28002 RepID=A0AA86TLV4_9EUKA|nr:Hypothetical protein HINF_LOCUS10184 [Hexamita inflata]